MKKKQYINFDDKLSDIVQQNNFLLLMLEHFDIYMPFGEKTLNEVCLENDINKNLLRIFANLFTDDNCKYSIEFSDKDAKTIIEYLKNSHQHYIKEKYPQIQQDIKKMYNKNNSKEIKLLEKFFNDYFNEVKEHFAYENNVVFPYIQQLMQNNNENFKLKQKYSVAQYKEHHDDIEEKLLDLKNLLIKYLPRQVSQIVRRSVILNLFELEHDIRIHSKIENLILIPLVEKMEQNIPQNG